MYEVLVAGIPGAGQDRILRRLAQSAGVLPPSPETPHPELLLDQSGSRIRVQTMAPCSALGVLPQEELDRFLQNLAHPPHRILLVLDRQDPRQSLYLLMQLLDLGLSCALVDGDPRRRRGPSLRVVAAQLGVPLLEEHGHTGQSLSQELLSILLPGGADFASPPPSPTEAMARLRTPDAVRTRWEKVDAVLAAAQEAADPHLDRAARLDTFLLHRFLGLPLFLLSMLALFVLTFELGKYPVALLEHGLQALRSGLHAVWPALLPDWTRSLLLDGLLEGVGGVLVYIPNIMLLFFGLSIMETSGYMARSAFLMDALMSRMGLQGKSFLPMLMGLGCSVPAIMAARRLENRHDRLITILVIPFVPCGARLPIFMLLIPAFIPEVFRGPALFLVYLTGMAFAFLAAAILNRTLVTSGAEPFLLELPTYRRPSLRAALGSMWFNAREYLKKAGTVLLLATAILWAAASYHPGEQSPGPESSLMGHLGRAIEPVLAPIGFDWRLSTAAVGAVAAKEVFVSQLAVLFAIEGEGDSHLSTIIARHYSVATGLSVLLFMLLTFPCTTTLIVTARETGSWRWSVLQFVLLAVTAWVVAFLVYNVACLFA
jgi:Fe2+ transport system protein B